ncbi:MAG: adenylosuccinate lyase [Bacteroidia bacterium]
MQAFSLHAVSPIDGRYQLQTQVLSDYFSEYGLICYRYKVEIAYFLALDTLRLKGFKPLSSDQIQQITALSTHFCETDALAIKAIESTTNHDVKAVEYYIKQQFTNLQLQDWCEFIHFGLTSQDINNTAVPLALKECNNLKIDPLFHTLIEDLLTLAKQWHDIPMLARTHGQAASPTRLGKELMVFVERLKRQMERKKGIPFVAKFGGATGNFNAHVAAYPQTDWIEFANSFVSDQLGLERLQFTTQIEHYDDLAAYFDQIKRLNSILIDLCRDMWAYISLHYFKQVLKPGEVGSSAMPHKVNPIDFENAEGNLGIANAMFEHLAGKLPVSRLQRDLTDSTVLRNIGVPMAHCIIAWNSIRKGLSKLLLNPEALEADLNAHWSVLAEAIQTILRREGYPKPYEALKALTRTHNHVNAQTLHAFIDSLNVSSDLKTELKSLSPQLYTGINPPF